LMNLEWNLPFFFQGGFKPLVQYECDHTEQPSKWSESYRKMLITLFDPSVGDPCLHNWQRLFCLCLNCFVWSDWAGRLGLRWHISPQGNCIQLVLAVLAEWPIWIKIRNLKDGGYGDKDRHIWERRGDITIIRASSFAHKQVNSLWGHLSHQL